MRCKRQNVKKATRARNIHEYIFLPLETVAEAIGLKVNSVVYRIGILQQKKIKVQKCSLVVRVEHQIISTLGYI